MDDFINNENTEKNETADSGFKEEESRTEEQAGTADTPFTQPEPVNQEPVYNKINYTEVKPITDYKPMSKGLRVFAAVMAGVILLTAASVTGYFLGRNKSSYTSKSKANISLAAKPANTDEMTAAQVYDKVNDSIVGITVYNTAGNGSQASGVFYSEDGYIVTNDHIYSEVPAAKFKIYTSDGKQYDAKYVAGDKISDLAILKIDGGSFTPAVFGDSEQIVYGENVVAIGRPSDATEASSITKGIISSVARRVKTTTSYSAKLIQTDSAINPGSSGGALVNMYGQVVGITSSKLAGVSYDAVGYAIPTKTMKRICSELIKQGKVVSRAKLGITYTAINSVTAEIGGYSHEGLYVASVSEDSDLYGKIGEGDIITGINGTEVTSDDIVLDIIDNCSAGDKISVTVVTKTGAEKSFEAALKANIGESSYSTDINAGTSGSSGSDSSSGGTFNFPFGE